MVENYFRGIAPLGSGITNGLMLGEDIRQGRQRNALAEQELKMRQQRIDMDQGEYDRQGNVQGLSMLYEGVKAGDPNAVEAAIGALGKIAPMDPRAADMFRRDPTKLIPALERIAGIQPQEALPSPSSQRIGEFDVLMQGDKVIGHRGVRPEPATRVVVGGGMGKPPSGYRFTEEGELQPIPGGPFDPNNRAAQAAASAQGRVTGTTQAEAQADLPRAEANAQGMLNVLDQLEQSPGFKYLWGAYSLTPGGAVPGTPQADALAVWEQVQGKAFLEAFSTLKGGGQITEKEGEKATAAITRLSNRKQSAAGAKAAINDLRAVVQAGVARAKRKAGTAPSDAAPPQGGLTPEEQAELEALRQRFRGR